MGVTPLQRHFKGVGAHISQYHTPSKNHLKESVNGIDVQ